MVRPNVMRVHWKVPMWHTNAVFICLLRVFAPASTQYTHPTLWSIVRLPGSSYIHSFAAMDNCPSWSLSSTCGNKYRTATFRLSFVRTGLGWTIPTWLVRWCQGQATCLFRLFIITAPWVPLCLPVTWMVLVRFQLNAHLCGIDVIKLPRPYFSCFRSIFLNLSSSS